MINTKDITAMCKAGRIQEAYQLMHAELAHNLSIWNVRALGWVLYYSIKAAADTRDEAAILANLEELAGLKELATEAERMVYDNVVFQVAHYIHQHLTPEKSSTPAHLSRLFAQLQHFRFLPSKGYSYLLQAVLKCDMWHQYADFLTWWNLDNLAPEDYVPYRMDNGKNIMSLAERAFIAKAKTLLRLRNPEVISLFLPQLEQLMETHPEMTYPGYFYAKLLVALGDRQSQSLQALLPFARKKATEFWVWQLLSELFVDDEEKQLACLIRAVHCRTQEEFLGKVRTKLTGLFVQRQLFALAKFQLDKIVQTYQQHGWHLPREIEHWTSQPWMQTEQASDEPPLDYRAITDAILCEGTQTAFAVVTYFDANTRRYTLVYAKEQRVSQKLPFKVGVGAVLQVNYVTEANGKLRVVHATPATLPTHLNYAREVEGTVKKRTDKDFAFIQAKGLDLFVSPSMVQRHQLRDKQQVKALALLDYNKKKDAWNWVCLTIKP